MNVRRLNAVSLLSMATVAVALVFGDACEAVQWGFVYNPQNNTAGLRLGGYQAQYQWGPGWLNARGYGPQGYVGSYGYGRANGLPYSYYNSPGYSGATVRGPGVTTGGFSTPWLNGGKPFYWAH